MIVALFGKSGAGKDKIAKLLAALPNIESMVSVTTRPKREKEVDGVDYIFKSKEEFLDMIDNNQLLEYRTYDTLVDNKPDTWYYGTPVQNFDRHKVYVCVLTIDGIKQLKKTADDVIAIYIDASEETRTERAKYRGSFDLSEWNRRLQTDNADFNYKDVHDLADLQFINEEFEDLNKIKINIVKTIEKLRTYS